MRQAYRQGKQKKPPDKGGRAKRECVMDMRGRGHARANMRVFGKRVSAKADEEQRRELYEQFSAVVTKYLPMEDMRKGAYIVMIAKSPDELVTEGETLCHCVGRGNYDQRVAREESLIFFVRKAEDPKTPLITIEFNIKSKKMLQCYGKGNTSPSEEAKAFIEGTWLPYAKRKLRKFAA